MYHAVVIHSTFPDGRAVPHHTRHRTQAAAARSLSRGITMHGGTPRPGWNVYCSVVTPDRRVLSLRQAQGKMDGRCEWEGLCEMMLEVTGEAV